MQFEKSLVKHFFLRLFYCTYKFFDTNRTSILSDGKNGNTTIFFSVKLVGWCNFERRPTIYQLNVVLLVM